MHIVLKVGGVQTYRNTSPWNSYPWAAVKLLPRFLKWVLVFEFSLSIIVKHSPENGHFNRKMRMTISFTQHLAVCKSYKKNPAKYLNIVQMVVKETGGRRINYQIYLKKY